METVKRSKELAQHFFLPTRPVYEAELVPIMSPPLSRSGLASYPGHVVGGKSDHVAWV